MSTPVPTLSHQPVAFVGGGNMASAMLGGLLRQAWPADRLLVIEPSQEQRQRLGSSLGIVAQAEPDERLQQARLVVWAVKPQVLREAARAAVPWLANPLHLSVAAGVRSDSLASWLGSQRVVRAMPNTPALVGRGMTGLFARPGVSAAERSGVEEIIRPTGQWLWFEDEAQLDAVTALSGSGPAYVFYVLEAMVEAGVGLGLSHAQAHQLAVATFVGASALAQSSDEPPQLLRQRVTSKGGTTHAAITRLEQAGTKTAFVQAIAAAAARARELGQELGA